MKAYRTLQRTIRNADVIAHSLEQLVAGIANQSDLINRKFGELIATGEARSEQRAQEAQQQFERVWLLLVEQAGQIAALTGQLSERQAENTALAGQLAEQNARIAALAGQLAEQNAQVEALVGQLSERQAENAALAGQLAEQHGQIGVLAGQLAEVAMLRRELADQQIEFGALGRQLAEERAHRQRLETHDEIRAADLRGLGERVDNLQLRISELVQYCERVTSGLVPPDLSGARKRVAELTRQKRPVPDELQETLLRLELRSAPFDMELTYTLVALLHRLRRPPLPDPPMAEADAAPKPEAVGTAELLQEAGRYAEAGDTHGVYACLWQIVMRYPQSARGWAEYARHFADREEWIHCAIAAGRAIASDSPPDRATATAALTALAALAAKEQIGTLDWMSWLERLPASLHSHPQLANLLLWTGNLERAAALLPTITRRKKADADGWIVAANIAFEREQWPEAYQYWRRALETDLPRALRAGVTEFSSRFMLVLDRAHTADEVADWISNRWDERNPVNLIPALRSPESYSNARAMRQEAIERGLPSVMLITLGKSASTSIGSLFHHGFGLVTVLYSLGNLRVILPWLKDYLRGGACYVTHLEPSEQNIDLLIAGGVKNVIVNVRDPRQWVISMAGHTQKYANAVIPSWRQHSSRREQVIDFVCKEKELLPGALEWIDGWVSAQDKLTVNFTTFEEFVRDKDAFVERCLSLYGGDRRYFDREAALTEHAGIDYHRRVGSTDEWRSVLTREQIDTVNRMIPDRLWNIFGWEP